MSILSIDASTKNTGWAVFEGANIQDCGYISAASSDMIARIHKMTDKLREIILKHPDIHMIILEEVRPEIGSQTNQKTHKALMYLQAAIAFLIHDEFPSIKIEYVYPSSWRKECGIKTGSGRRRDVLKQEDIRFVKNTYHIDVANNDDIADAICIGHAYIHKNNEINWE